MLVMNTN